MVTERVSTTRTGISVNVSAAVTAEAYVAESLEEMVRQSTASAPSAAARWNACMNMPGRGRGGFGQIALALAPVPELVGRELAAILELLGAETDGERYDQHVVRFDQVLGEVTGAVGHNPHTGHPTSLPRAPGRCPL